MEFKHISEHNIKHELNTALNNLLNKEKIKIKGEDLAYSVGLESDYYELLKAFEEHLKFVIKVNKGV